MKKILLLLLLLPFFANGQFNYPGPFYSSTKFTFSTSDSLIHYDAYGSRVIIDTSSSVLWQIGNTLKPIFSSSTTPFRGIMTDTLHSYPANANDFFVLKIYFPLNCIVDFWHKYQTDSLHAGGLIEFSTDDSTWLNITDCPAIDTQNFYSSKDTLISGRPAFTGTSNGEQLSRFQLMNCAALRVTSTACFPNTYFGVDPIYIRFRFVSDSTLDSLSGWMIDSIKIEYSGCGEGVTNIIADNKLVVYPNPVATELTISSSDRTTKVAISNLLGQTVYTNEYNTEEVQINVADLPAGVYFIKINGTEVKKFVKE